ncbi:hypothetical protein CRUP_037840 [Coryphaenoides rupestris]|nr:hypothetical protein CRUP_037840 [Coryphaenoides rupestris]
MKIDYLETAFQIIQDHPQVISDRVGILGLSYGLVMLWGGETKAHADAQEDSWWRILAFLKRYLCIQPSPATAPQAKL